MDWTTDESGFDFPRRKDFSLPESLHVGSGGHSSSKPFPSAADVKKDRSHTSTPLYTSMAGCLIKHMDSFTFAAFVTENRSGVQEWKWNYNGEITL
jgi:hypothetical protein